MRNRKKMQMENKEKEQEEEDQYMEGKEGKKRLYKKVTGIRKPLYCIGVDYQYEKKKQKGGLEKKE